MKYIQLIILSIIFSSSLLAEVKTIHVFVALCDNENQGIVPVNSSLGNGQNPKSNLYWGAAYGVSTYFKRHKDWDKIVIPNSIDPNILDRVLFKLKGEDVYLLAEAYDGARIKDCTEDFFMASDNNLKVKIDTGDQSLQFGGNSDLVVYVGHNGLMDFDIKPKFNNQNEYKDVMVLACMSKSYFNPFFRVAKANPILTTKSFMAPEAYSLESAIRKWLSGGSLKEIKESAAQSYNKYQKCGIKGARSVFTNGF